jgi:hypothetical protein
VLAYEPTMTLWMWLGNQSRQRPPASASDAGCAYPCECRTHKESKLRFLKLSGGGVSISLLRFGLA